MLSLLNHRTYRRAGPFASCLTLVLGMLPLVGCQSSAEQARHEMEPAYRSAKLLRERLKARATLAEFNRLRADLAAELGFISDRMKANHSTARLLQPYFSAYSNALDAYLLVGDVWEFNSAMDACEAPRYEYTEHQFADASPSEQMRMLIAVGKSDTRMLHCIESTMEARDALGRRAPQCGASLDCVVKIADGKLSAADTLLTDLPPSNVT